MPAFLSLILNYNLFYTKKLSIYNHNFGLCPKLRIKFDTNYLTQMFQCCNFLHLGYLETQINVFKSLEKQTNLKHLGIFSKPYIVPQKKRCSLIKSATVYQFLEFINEKYGIIIILDFVQNCDYTFYLEDNI